MEAESLTGHLLIAMPTMDDPNFQRTVTLLCEHSEQGAMGIVINRPLEMDLAMVFEQLSLETFDSAFCSQPVLCGGPVQQERGFVLHDSPHPYDATVSIGDQVYVTSSQDVLTAMARGDGPERAIVALGYAGWGAGQLEVEMAANAWLSVRATPDILFETPFGERWRRAAGLLGIDLARLSPDAGHA